MLKKVLAVLFAVFGIIGAVLSVGMLISAVRLLEWGRVLLYCVTLAVCVELAVINLINLKPKKDDE